MREAIPACHQKHFPPGPSITQQLRSSCLRWFLFVFAEAQELKVFFYGDAITQVEARESFFRGRSRSLHVFLFLDAEKSVVTQRRGALLGSWKRFSSRSPSISHAAFDSSGWNLQMNWPPFSTILIISDSGPATRANPFARHVRGQSTNDGRRMEDVYKSRLESERKVTERNARTEAGRHGEAGRMTYVNGFCGVGALWCPMVPSCGIFEWFCLEVLVGA